MVRRGQGHAACAASPSVDERYLRTLGRGRRRRQAGRVSSPGSDAGSRGVAEERGGGEGDQHAEGRGARERGGVVSGEVEGEAERQRA